MDTLIYNATIITMDDEETVIDRGYIRFNKERIVTIAEGEPTQKEKEETTQMNANGKWLMPGLVNTHGHPGMTLLRGISDDQPLQEWLEQSIWPAERKFDEKTLHVARDVSMIEMIASGTTAFVDMYHLGLPSFANRIEEVGIRATLMRSVIGLCSKEEQDEKLAESLSFATAFHGQANGRITTMLAPHAPYTCPPDYIERIVEAARDANLPVHMHLAETRKEIHDFMDQHGMHPLELLEERDLLAGTKWLFAHCVHMYEQHFELIQQRGAMVSHNPMSNMKLGSGIAPVASMLKHDIPVSIGTDSVAANNHLDLFEEMRFAVLLQRGVNEQADIVKTYDGLKMATINGSKATYVNQVGALQPGNEADFIMLSPNQAHLLPEQRVLSHLVFSAKGTDVTDVFVQGKPLYRNKEFVTMDKEKIMAEARSMSAVNKKLID
ncbi:amidohydrolase [Shouchella lehensis]|uniref:5-methylthioadenosine/S-adenosylhomocysteine deaminase n=1 Tax=Shouchella lehensis TaxID=300825 RepID=A0A4Y7WP62_9BACI|nr:amidohydrolase [Shouchella lehensis]MBG9784534.1 N-ethylammeline chlorohydrolase [Shouchella lehensis]TES50459.1 amidohydrolase [Shouchella lehensis]